MAINPETQYPGKIAPSTPEYPYGAARNITVPGDGTGTPWEAALVNDLFGWQQALLSDVAIVPSGSPDKVGASQYLDALKAVATAITQALRPIKTYSSLVELGIDDSFFVPNSTVAERQDRLNDLAVLMGDNSRFEFRLTTGATFANFRACMPLSNHQGVFTLTNIFAAYWTCSYTVVTSGTSDSLRSFYWGRITNGVDDWQEHITAEDGVTNKLLMGDEIRFQGASGGNALMQKNASSLRDELQIYSAGDAFSTGSLGAGVHLYGNSDIKHAGNFTVLTGQDDQGDARLIVSGGSNNPASDGYRTNTDTRVTIGNAMFDWVDDQNDSALLNLKNPINCPALYITEASQAEGDIATGDGEKITLGHWDGVSVFTPRVELTPSGNWSPAFNGVGGLGSGVQRWSEVFAVNGTINTSDENEKQQIEDLSEAEKRVAKKIAVKKFKFNDAVAKKGDGARWHFGVIAQEVKAAFESEGLDGFAYGVLCFDKWGDVTERRQTNKGEKVEVKINAPQFKDVKKTRKEIVERDDGRHVLKTVEYTEREPVLKMVDLYDEAGEKIDEVEVQVTAPVTVLKDADPVYEDVVLTPAGERYGVRYDELYAFILDTLI